VGQGGGGCAGSEVIDVVFQPNKFPEFVFEAALQADEYRVNEESQQSERDQDEEEAAQVIFIPQALADGLILEALDIEWGIARIFHDGND
jgi:hypothetical protein